MGVFKINFISPTEKLLLSKSNKKWIYEKKTEMIVTPTQDPYTDFNSFLWFR